MPAGDTFIARPAMCSPSGSTGTPKLSRRPSRKAWCSAGQAGGHTGGVEPAVVGAHVLLGQQEVDAEGGAAALLPDPGQVVVELVGGVADGAQHPEAADAAHRRHDVTAMAERQDGELDPQLVLDPGAHGKSVASLVAASAPLRLAPTPFRSSNRFSLDTAPHCGAGAASTQNSMTNRPRVPPAASWRWASPASAAGSVRATRRVTAPSSTCWRRRSSLACSFR